MLIHTDASELSVRRRRAGRGWSYWRPEGTRITDRAEIDRLNAIGLPPAYRNARLSDNPDSHIQATGYDARGRKQYRYHPEFRARKESEKFDRTLEFGESVPRLRRCVEQDLRMPGMTKTKVVAAIVRLLDSAAIRIGNEHYARENNSFGATTLRTRHAKLNGSTLQLRFAAKSGRHRDIEITDPLLARVVRRCQDLPGQHLFSYVDEDGSVRPISSTDVNDYIRDATQGDFTAKHFRTWWASVLAYSLLRSAEEQGPTATQLFETVSDALGNTPAIARKSYIHPALLQYLETSARLDIPILSARRATKYLSAEERGLMDFLQARGRRRRHPK